MTAENKNRVSDGFHRRKRRYISVVVILAIAVAALCIAMLLLGNTIYSLSTVWKVLTGEAVKGATFAVRTLRLPRMLAGLLSGFAFGMAGSTFQTMLRNPLASPDIIGVTSGSNAAAIFLLIIMNLSGAVVSVGAVLGGTVTAVFIYLLSKGGKFEGGRLILIGLGVQAMLNAFISYLLLKAPQHDVPAAYRWLSGSLNGIQLSEIPMLAIVVIIFTPVIILLGKHLRILELGEDSAITLGLHADRTRILLILSAVVSIAFATATTGPIAFISFLSGPIATRIAGAGTQNELPAGLVGALLVLAGDLIGQFAFDTRFPVGVITGILGAPYLIYLLIRMNKTGGAS
ncbi:FecCD family ABC transporter permease [Novisyntrophococcus fermenticellae]|uniref:FecCD family ABC transporter permease n=1 Tax=Novisyntrophococcus fermenticellae TaxID=2068655 RepID=UPI001E54D6DB|nr:iron chelate uptake ABC transporter family permease subunit [Novisyntrophococcus fermenticellae]